MKRVRDHAGVPEIEAGCPELYSANMHGCVALSRLALDRQTALERLEVGGCKALRNIVSSSSTLEGCFVQSCPRLTVNSETLCTPQARDLFGNGSMHW